MNIPLFLTSHISREVIGMFPDSPDVILCG